MSNLKSRALEGAGAALLQTTFRAPDAEDGKRVWKLIAACSPLDRNSLYCNLLQCTHFVDTCMLAQKDGDIVGWVSAYRPPHERETLFVWQVAVHEKARGQGLGRLMLEKLLSRASMRDVLKIKTTITPENEASWNLFRSLAKKLSAPCVSEAWFERDEHFGGRHETEHLVTIGPFGAFNKC